MSTFSNGARRTLDMSIASSIIPAHESSAAALSRQSSKRFAEYAVNRIFPPTSLYSSNSNDKDQSSVTQQRAEQRLGYSYSHTGPEFLGARQDTLRHDQEMNVLRSRHSLRFRGAHQQPAGSCHLEGSGLTIHDVSKPERKARGFMHDAMQSSLEFADNAVQSMHGVQYPHKRSSASYRHQVHESAVLPSHANNYGAIEVGMPTPRQASKRVDAQGYSLYSGDRAAALIYGIPPQQQQQQQQQLPLHRATTPPPGGRPQRSEFVPPVRDGTPRAVRLHMLAGSGSLW